MLDLYFITVTHSAISSAALLLGAYVLYALARAHSARSAETWFIALAFLTSATGFFFHFEKLMPSHIVGVIALLVLAATIVARYAKHLAGGWRVIYGVGLTVSVWLDAFVAVAQAFAKIPVLKPLAPTPNAPAFGIAQTVLLLFFVAVGVAVVKGLRRDHRSL